MNKHENLGLGFSDILSIIQSQWTNADKQF